MYTQYIMENTILNSVFSLQKQIKKSEKNLEELHKIANETSEKLSLELRLLHTKTKELEAQNEKLKKSLAAEKMNNNNIYSLPEDNVQCILCFDHQRNVLFRPCNHILICDKCSAKTSFDECIVCKLQIDTYEYAYL